MKTQQSLFPLFLLFLIPYALAQTTSVGFVTPRDMLHAETNSNISLQNNRNTNVTVYGLYVRQYAYVPVGGSCTSATTIYTGNVTGGSFVTPVDIKAASSVNLGSNYLYNMIMQAIYYANIIIPSPPGCALPGCTWGSDTIKYNWCIYLGALAPVANSSSYSSNVPPSTDVASGSGYNYNLVSSYIYLGPISCNDQTLTCQVTNPQTQSFS